LNSSLAQSAEELERW